MINESKWNKKQRQNIFWVLSEFFALDTKIGRIYHSLLLNLWKTFATQRSTKLGKITNVQESFLFCHVLSLLVICTKRSEMLQDLYWKLNGAKQKR